ncbi:LRR receptor-like serine/threonine-protein kinase HSL2 [Capsicum annuum]|uniref:LRR receptor-like serine/threonine-protein kinase HSL2 n=1 Tax=Capsicum annuum TaxID=4072 RepID=UPI001FB0D157|nr:LRR receptor-like serine/threonine-protein kinase HSL2 [Capsicum annuum]
MVKDVHRLANLGVRLLNFEDGGVVLHDISKSYLCGEVKEKQAGDPILIQIKCDVGHQKVMSSEIGGDGLGNLKDLLDLDLSSNNMVGSLPPEIGNLKVLVQLDLSMNGFSNEIPREIGGLCRRGKIAPQQADSVSTITRERISFYELLQVTDELSESNLIGSGSFGTVYKGILRSGVVIAVKVFILQLDAGFKSFDTECEVFRSLRHRNLVKVITSCSNLDSKAIVLEYMPNGSLEKYLYSHNYFLDIMQRLSIMIDVACALEYLHHGCSLPVIHCYLKPSNVLLDEDMVSHLSDFGISKLLGEDESDLYTKTLATLGYIAPEYGLDGLVSTKCDIYSYGIMLLETFTRRKPNDFEGDVNLKQWVSYSLPEAVMYVVDANLLTSTGNRLRKELDVLASIMKVAFDCCAESPARRTNMKDVVGMLQMTKIQLLECGSFLPCISISHPGLAAIANRVLFTDAEADSAKIQTNITTDQLALFSLKSQIVSDPFHFVDESWSPAMIPREFGNLSFLVSLDLGSNNFH